MLKQILLIHGGDAFNSYEEYLTDLRNKTVSLDRLRQTDWKSTLQERLGPDYEVIAPRMPCAQNAKYLEWKIWFDKIVPLLNDNLILIGHSLGGISLAKYLSENTSAKTIRAIFLVAAPFNTPAEHPLADFVLRKDLKNLTTQAQQIFLYHSRDDEIVPFSNFENYSKALPKAEQRIFATRQHFNQADFPELIDDIRSLS